MRSLNHHYRLDPEAPQKGTGGKRGFWFCVAIGVIVCLTLLANGLLTGRISRPKLCGLGYSLRGTPCSVTVLAPTEGWQIFFLPGRKNADVFRIDLAGKGCQRGTLGKEEMSNLFEGLRNFAIQGPKDIHDPSGTTSYKVTLDVHGDEHVTEFRLDKSAISNHVQCATIAQLLVQTIEKVVWDKGLWGSGRASGSGP